MARHVLEVRTSLGDTLLELAVIDRARQLGDLAAARTADGFALTWPGGEAVVRAGTTVNLRRGLAEIAATVRAEPVQPLPRAPGDRRAAAYLALSFAAHVALLVAAFEHRSPGPAAGPRRPRLVANHASLPHARPDTTSVASIHDDDRASGVLPPTAMAADDGPGEAQPDPLVDKSGDDDESHRSARDIAPCAGGDCGLIASGPYQTRGDSGAGYDLAPRQPQELDLSVVACSVDGGCNTTSGKDQQDIRAEIARHVGELHGCFGASAATSAAVELAIDDDGNVHVTTREGDAIAGCLARVLGKLELHGGARDVTLAFARD